MIQAEVIQPTETMVTLKAIPFSRNLFSHTYPLTLPFIYMRGNLQWPIKRSLNMPLGCRRKLGQLTVTGRMQNSTQPTPEVKKESRLSELLHCLLRHCVAQAVQAQNSYLQCVVPGIHSHSVQLSALIHSCLVAQWSSM